jgi:DUF4097 and DUF4098 domain-containing protein YvlB
MKMKILMIAVLVVTLAVMLQAGQTDLVKKRFETDPAKQAVIYYSGVDGNVFVETHDKNEILFTFEKTLKGSKSKRNVEYFEKIHPDIEFEDNTLDIKIKYPKRSFNLFRSLSGFRVKVKARLIVPVNTDVKLKVVDGDLDAADLKGKVQLKTVDGDILVKGCEGPLTLNTVDGDIEVNRCTGALRTGTIDGDIKASGVFSVLRFKSVDGEGEFTLAEGSRLTDNCSIGTVDGDIRLTVPKDFAFKLDFKADDGDVDINHVEFQDVTLKKKNRFEGRRGDAKYTIKIRSVDGDLTLEEL